jgi:hypothetical protein
MKIFGLFKRATQPIRKHRRSSGLSHRAKRLVGIESLENREVMAANITSGVTLASTNPAIAPSTIGTAPSVARVNAVVSGQTLYVEGTERADNIVVRQAGNTFSVDGVRILYNGVAQAAVNSSQIKKVEVRGYNGIDTIDLSNVSVPCEVWGGDGSDIITGGSGADTLRGEGGDDQIAGMANNDRLFGGAGVDRLFGNDGDDWLYGGTENDLLYGGRHNDKLFGEAGLNDKLYGEGGNDWLEAGSMYELADGGTGTDYNAHVWAVDGAEVSDIKQAYTGTCSFLSSLAAASRFYDLSGNISYEGNFTYAVWLFDEAAGGWIQERVTFDGTLRTAVGSQFDPTSATEGESWTIIYQRAYLQHFYGMGDSNWILSAWFDGETGEQPLKAITGLTPTWFNPDGDFPEYAQALTAAGPMVVGDGEHAYMVRDLYQDETGTWFVNLYNPWGTDETHTSELATEPETPTFTNNDGFITVKYDVFRSVFKHGFAV